MCFTSILHHKMELPLLPMCCFPLLIIKIAALVGHLTIKSKLHIFPVSEGEDVIAADYHPQFGIQI